MKTPAGVDNDFEEDRGKKNLTLADRNKLASLEKKKIQTQNQLRILENPRRFQEESQRHEERRKEDLQLNKMTSKY